MASPKPVGGETSTAIRKTGENACCAQDGERPATRRRQSKTLRRPDGFPHVGSVGYGACPRRMPMPNRVVSRNHRWGRETSAGSSMTRPTADAGLRGTSYELAPARHPTSILTDDGLPHSCRKIMLTSHDDGGRTPILCTSASRSCAPPETRTTGPDRGRGTSGPSANPAGRRDERDRNVRRKPVPRRVEDLLRPGRENRRERSRFQQAQASRVQRQPYGVGNVAWRRRTTIAGRLCASGMNWSDGSIPEDRTSRPERAEPVMSIACPVAGRRCFTVDGIVEPDVRSVPCRRHGSVSCLTGVGKFAT